MLSPERADRLIGGVIFCFGIVFCVHTVMSFDLGTFRRIGPGMFPLGLGIVLTLLGLGIAILAPDRDRENPDFSVRTMVLVLVGLAAFAVTIFPFGLFPAIISLVMISSVAERPFKPLGAIGVSLVLCVTAWLIFSVGLGLSISMLRWPF